MEQINLLYSYEEYKGNKKSLSAPLKLMSEDYLRMINLSFEMNRTKEEEEELKNLQQKTKGSSILEGYTRKTHEITDKYIDLKDIHDDEQRNDIYNEIGRMQCQIEVLKEKWNNINNS